MTRMNLSQSPFFGSNTRPPLYLSFFPFVVVAAAPSPSSASFLMTTADFFPQLLSGQIYFSRWNSCSKMYSLRSARPPFRVLFLKIAVISNAQQTNLAQYSPRIAGEVGELFRQGKDLNFRGNCHLKMSVRLAMSDKS